jgi:hypothetical protein
MADVATIILNRNLPEVTDRLWDKIQAHNNGETDLYVVESGSTQDQLSRHTTAWADWDEALKEGLRYPRGFNFGLWTLLREGRFQRYDYFFLVCNDAEFDGPMVPALLEEMRKHPRVGIISPCGEQWAERELLRDRSTAYVWHINHVLWMVRKEFIELIMERATPSYINLLYDGTNFRGYCADLELVIKGYVNEYATALTKSITFSENTDLLRDQADLIKTDPFDLNQRRVFEEGREWMRRKYGFVDRAQMQLYAKMFYDRFFEMHPQLEGYRL